MVPIDSHQHPLAGISFPATIGGLVLDEVHQYDDWGHTLSAGFRQTHPKGLQALPRDEFGRYPERIDGQLAILLAGSTVSIVPGLSRTTGAPQGLCQEARRNPSPALEIEIPTILSFSAKKHDHPKRR